MSKHFFSLVGEPVEDAEYFIICFISFSFLFFCVFWIRVLQLICLLPIISYPVVCLCIFSTIFFHRAIFKEVHTINHSFKKSYLFIWKSYKEREQTRSFTCLFTLQIAATLDLGWFEARSKVLPLYGCRGPNTRTIFCHSSRHIKGADLEVEQLEPELVPIWNACLAGGALLCATALAPVVSHIGSAFIITSKLLPRNPKSYTFSSTLSFKESIILHFIYLGL